MNVLSDRFFSWRQLLSQIITDLDLLTQQAEKIFQSFAKYLEQIRLSNDECAAGSGLVIQSIDKQQGLNLNVFGDFHNSISASVNSTLSDITTSLDKLMVKIAEILDLKSTLEEVSYSIKNVSLLMKIKTTKMGKSEFDHVVKGLENLARQIKENTEGINISAQEASENITLTCEQIEERLYRFNRLIKPSQEKIADLLETFGDIASNSRDKCKQIKTLSDQSNPKIESIQKMGALQPKFLLKIKAVREALSKTVSALSRENVDDTDGSATIRQVVDTVTEQIEHVAHWCRELETADSRTAEDMKSMLLASEKQIDEAKLIADSVFVIGEKLVDFEKDFNRISTTLSFSEEKTRELLEAISNIDDNVHNVSRQVSQIDIGRNDLEALTYNAVFKAAKVGMQGKVMESITDEITGLSREVHSKVTDKEAVIKSIVSSSKEFKGSLSEKLNRQLTFSKEINQKIREQSRKFFNDAESVSELNKKTQQLGAEINRFMTETRFDQPLNDQLQKIRTRMTEIIAEMRL